jgi:hypothetical protein
VGEDCVVGAVGDVHLFWFWCWIGYQIEFKHCNGYSL